jgi:hypothetical protein
LVSQGENRLKKGVPNCSNQQLSMLLLRLRL